MSGSRGTEGDLVCLSCYYPEPLADDFERRAMKEEPIRALARLCADMSTAGSNLLHLLTTKKDFDETVSEERCEIAHYGFGAERARAAEELARRGNDVEAFRRFAP